MPRFHYNRIKMIEMLIERCALSVPQNRIQGSPMVFITDSMKLSLNIIKGVKIPLASLNKVMLNT